MFKVGDLVTITANEPYGTTTMTKGNVEVVRSVVTRTKTQISHMQTDTTMA